jgi:hypothetical protein
MHASVSGISNLNAAARFNVHIQARSTCTDWHTSLDCAILNNITNTMPSTKLNVEQWHIPRDITLADPRFNIPGEIDLLIGADVFYDILRPDKRTKPGNFPALQETELGWIVSGRTPMSAQDRPRCTLLLRDDDSIERNLNHFWEIDPVEKPNMAAEQDACEKHFLTHSLTHIKQLTEDSWSDSQ